MTDMYSMCLNVVLKPHSPHFRVSMKVVVNLSGLSAKPAKTSSFVQRRTDITRENVKHGHSTADTANSLLILKKSR